MPRNLSSRIKEAMAKRSTGLILLWLVEITHPKMIDDFGALEVIRLVNNNENVVSNGKLYNKCSINIRLPESKESGTSSGNIIIDNVSQQLIPLIRSLSGEFTITLKLVCSSNLDVSPPEFDNVEITPLPYKLINISWNASEISGELSYSNIFDNRYPFPLMTKFLFPGLI